MHPPTHMRERLWRDKTTWLDGIASPPLPLLLPIPLPLPALPLPFPSLLSLSVRHHSVVIKRKTSIYVSFDLTFFLMEKDRLTIEMVSLQKKK